MDTKQGWKIATTIILIAAVVAIAGWGWRVYSNRDQSSSNTQTGVNGNSAVITLTANPSQVFHVGTNQDWFFEIVRGWAEEIRVIDLDHPSERHSIEPGKHFNTAGIKRFQMLAEKINLLNGPLVVKIWTQ
ncbi:MAG: hypothetical protein WCW03_00380 [Candidatus Paceibacterota bacterium]|jgi:hypothetical protein